MVTVQDLEKVRSDNKLEKFIIETISAHNVSALEKNMLYYEGKNPYLTKLKIEVELADGNVLDLTPKAKIYSAFAQIIIDHGVSRLWDNPVQLDDNIDREILGVNFDEDVHEYARMAAIHGVSWVFYNNGAPIMFPATDFIPLPDEWDGEVRAGIRFWQIDPKKPMVIQLYEMDGFIEWRKEDGKDQLTPVDAAGAPTPKATKRSYRTNKPVGGQGYVETTAETPGAEYAEFPVVPYYPNPKRTSELTGPVKSSINFYDEKNTVYSDEIIMEKGFMWSVSGYGGQAKDLTELVEKARKLRIIADRRLDGDAQIDVSTTEAPYLSHKEAMDAAEAAIFRDARIMNPNVLMSGGVTTVAIRAAMQREDKKMVGVETEARRFVRRLLKVAGVESKLIAFKHRTLVNELEIVQMLAQGVSDLPFEYQVKLNPAIPADMQQGIIDAKAKEQLAYDEAAIAEIERKMAEARAAGEQNNG
ncbi:MAG: phage portal protein [Oscillospiraceae bacterium]|nr:phage portal protein [Oscillospiraceae bacterium]